jgi:hypothetical protein
MTSCAQEGPALCALAACAACSCGGLASAAAAGLAGDDGGWLASAKAQCGPYIDAYDWRSLGVRRGGRAHEGAA